MPWRIFGSSTRRSATVSFRYAAVQGFAPNVNNFWGCVARCHLSVNWILTAGISSHLNKWLWLCSSLQATVYDVLDSFASAVSKVTWTTISQAFVAYNLQNNYDNTQTRSLNRRDTFQIEWHYADNFDQTAAWIFDKSLTWSLVVPPSQHAWWSTRALATVLVPYSIQMLAKTNIVNTQIHCRHL